MSQPTEPSSPPSLLDAGGKIDQDALRAAVERFGPDDADARRVELTLLRDIKDRLDKYLTSRIPFMSRSQIQRMLDDGAATVNGKPARASTKLRLNDVVSLVLPPPPSGEIEPEDIPIDVLYEDEHLIALNKRPDIIVHPARSHNTGTMLGALAWHFLHSSGGELSPVGADVARPGVVHQERAMAEPHERGGAKLGGGGGRTADSLHLGSQIVQEQVRVEMDCAAIQGRSDRRRGGHGGDVAGGAPDLREESGAESHREGILA